ncbi:MAG: hypothetical protein A2138_25675 [Deltaproteobacteria bacterium RBG_16_71_12]|nr:MAG: hypothetical protein A2138_25675 [Deltaproteobacteria bacterium RBG_16_71_12]
MSLPSKSELKKNLRMLQAALRERPMDLDARMRVARTYRLLARKDDAVAHYAAVARYLSLAGHPLQAIAVLKELLQVDPKHDETLLFLAKLYARTRAADATNLGRVAVPILEARDIEQASAVQTLHDGIPLTTTGIWRAIAPVRADDLEVVKAPEEIGAEVVAEGAPAARGAPLFPDDEATAVDHGAPPSEGTGDAIEVTDADLGDDFAPLAHVTPGDVVLPQVPLFSSLSPEAFVQLSHAMVMQKAPAGAAVFAQGEPGDSCIVISRGRAQVYRTSTDGDEIELMQLSEGDLAGVFALMSAQTRQASLRAVTELEYFEIDRSAVDELMQTWPSVRAALQTFFRERLLLNVLASLPFFQKLDARERQDIMRRFHDRDYQPGDELFFEGAENDGLWVILEGKVHVGSTDIDGSVQKRLELAPGDYVGSLARVDAAQADLSAVAKTVAAAAVLPHKAFSDLLEQHKDIAGVRDKFRAAGILVGEHVFAGNGTLAGHLVGVRG